jgi:hypothetical protein
MGPPLSGIDYLLSGLLGFVPATGSAQREPVALLCREVKPDMLWEARALAAPARRLAKRLQPPA